MLSQPSAGHAGRAVQAGFCAGWGELCHQEQPDVFNGAGSLSPAEEHQACHADGTLPWEVIQHLVATIPVSKHLPCYVGHAWHLWRCLLLDEKLNQDPNAMWILQRHSDFIFLIHFFTRMKLSKQARKENLNSGTLKMLCWNFLQ